MAEYNPMQEAQNLAFKLRRLFFWLPNSEASVLQEAAKRLVEQQQAIEMLERYIQRRENRFNSDATLHPDIESARASLTEQQQRVAQAKAEFRSRMEGK